MKKSHVLSLLLAAAVLIAAILVAVPDAKAKSTAGEAYPDTYPVWHCECGNVWADTSHNGDAEAPTADLHYLYGEGKCKYDDATGVGCDGSLHQWTAFTTVGTATKGGYFYLTGNETAGQITIVAGKTLHLDLNGYFYSRTNSSAAGRMFSTNNLNSETNAGGITIMDNKGTGGCTLPAQSSAGDYSYSSPGGMFFANGKYGTVTLYSGTFSAAAAATQAASYGGVIHNGGTLNIFDGVTLEGGKVSTYGGTINQTISTGVINIFGGTIVGGTATTNGGALNVTAGTLKIYGGVIKDGTAKNGGNIYDTSASFTIKDCVISGGTATDLGGNIYTTKTLTLTGTTVENGTAGTAGGNIRSTGSVTLNSGTVVSGGTPTDDAGKSGDIYTSWFLKANGGVVNGSVYLTAASTGQSTSSSKHVVTGASKIGRLVIGYGTQEDYIVTPVDFSGLTEDSDVTIFVDTGDQANALITRQVAQNVTEDIQTFIKVANQVPDTLYNEKYYVGTDGVLHVGKIQCECGGALEGTEGHTCEMKIWSPVNQENLATDMVMVRSNGTQLEPLKAGHSYFYLTGNAGFTGTDASGEDIADKNLMMLNNKHLHLDLNGFALDLGPALINAYSTGLTVCNTGDAQTGKITNTGSSKQILFANQGMSAYFKIYGGVMESTATNVAVADITAGSLTVYGGAIQRADDVRDTLATAALVKLSATSESKYATFTMAGGTITGGNADNGGAVGLLNANAVFTMSGGTITDSVGKYGAVYVSNGTFTMNGGTITGGAVTDSKGISMVRGNLILKGSPVIDCGDGDIYVDNAIAIAYRDLNIDVTELNAPADPISVDLKINGAFTKVREDQVNWFVTAKTAEEDGVIENSYVNGYLYLSNADSAEIRNAKGETVESYHSVAEAVQYLTDENCEDVYIYQNRETHERVIYTGRVLYLDINGKQIRGSYELGAGTELRGMDSATNEYGFRKDTEGNDLHYYFYADVTNGTVASVIKAPNKMRYLATRSDLSGGGSKYSFDRFYVGISAITLNPVSGEVGYKAIIGGNENVRYQLEGGSYGFEVWVEGNRAGGHTFTHDIPLFTGDRSDVDALNAYLSEHFNVGKTGNKQTLTIAGQLATVNGDYSLESLKVTANAFIRLADGTVITSADYSYSLPEMFKLFDNSFAAQTDATKNGLSALYKRYEVMSRWDLTNIAAYGA